MIISVAVTLFTALVLLDPVEEVDADSSRLVIHTPQKINFIHRYHTSEHYAKDYGYGTHHNHHHVHHKPKKVVHHHRNRGGRWRGRKRYVWRKVGARTPYTGGKSYGMSNYAVNYRNWVPTSRRRARPKGRRPRDPPRHRESYLQPPDYSDYDSFAAHWEEEPSSSESNEIADYSSTPLNSGSNRRPDQYESPYDAGYDPLDDEPGVASGWQDAYGSQDSSEVGTFNVRDLDDLRVEPSRGISSNYRVSYKVNDRGSDHVQGYSTLPDELVSQFPSASPQRPPMRKQVSEWQVDHEAAHRERAGPSRQPQNHNFRGSSFHRDQTFGSSNTQHRHQPPQSNVLRKQNSAVSQTRPHRNYGSTNMDHIMTTPPNRPSEQDVYLQAFQAFSYRKQQQRQKQRTPQQRPQSEASTSHGGMQTNQWLQNSRGQSMSSGIRNTLPAPQLQHWPQGPKDIGSDHDIGYGEGLEDLNDEFRF